MAKPVLVIGNKTYSSWSLRPWLLLKELGIEFNEVRLPLDTPQFHAEIHRYNPAGKVPVLQQGTLRVWDSLAICEYVADQHPAAWPADPESRALARSVSAEMHSGFPALREKLPHNCRVRGRTVSFSEEVLRDVARIQEIWRTCRARSSSAGPWLFGSFCIADAMFAPVASRFVTYGVDCEAVEQAYVETVFAHPAMQQWVKEAEAEPEVLEPYEIGR